MWLSAIPAAIGLAQSAVGFANLSKLSKQKLPMYQETPEMMASRARANQMAQGGFTTAEQNAFDSRMAQQGNQRYRLGVTQGGGNLSSAINAGINYGNIGAQQQFAAQDAQLQRQNIKYADSFSQYVQNLANMNTSYMQQRRAQQEQAAGGAAQTGLNNIAGAAAMANFGAGNKVTPDGTTADTSGTVEGALAQNMLGTQQTGWGGMGRPNTGWGTNSYQLNNYGTAPDGSPINTQFRPFGN